MLWAYRYAIFSIECSPIITECLLTMTCPELSKDVLVYAVKRRSDRHSQLYLPTFLSCSQICLGISWNSTKLVKKLKMVWVSSPGPHTFFFLKKVRHIMVFVWAHRPLTHGYALQMEESMSHSFQWVIVDALYDSQGRWMWDMGLAEVSIECRSWGMASSEVHFLERHQPHW